MNEAVDVLPAAANAWNDESGGQRERISASNISPSLIAKRASISYAIIPSSRKAVFPLDITTTSNRSAMCWKVT